MTWQGEITRQSERQGRGLGSEPLLHEMVQAVCAARKPRGRRIRDEEVEG